METLPTIPGGKFPVVYVEARRALANCARIDECNAWADKAKALASYARQAKDDALLQLSTRIKARAIRRCGELLKQIEPSKGGDSSLFAREGGHPSVTRTTTATDAGLSEHQRKTALRVASVPEEVFEGEVESSNPPTVSELATWGTQHKERIDSVADLTDFLRFARFIGSVDPTSFAESVPESKRPELRRRVSEMDSWLDTFVTSL